MAIDKKRMQQRYGTFEQYTADKNNLLPNEFASVTSGDTSSTDGTALYFKSGTKEPIKVITANDNTFITVPDKEDNSNKVSSKTDITDSSTNYPSIKYLDNYYYGANETYSSEKTDELLGEKADKADVTNQLSELKEDLDNNILTFSYPNLIINQDEYTAGKFLIPNTGNEAENENWLYLNEYIPVKENTTYHGAFFDKKTCLKRSTFTCFVCFYDANKKCIGNGLSSITNETFITPKNVAYCRLSFSKSSYILYNLQVEEGETYTPYHAYGAYRIINGQSIDLYVGNDFIDIKKALDFIFAVKWNKRTNINIHIPNGTYDVFSLYATSTTVRGIELDENITLVGESRDGTILYGELDPNSYPYNVRTWVSTVNLNGGGNLKHLTIKGKNIRYAVHPDTVNSVYTDKITNYHRVSEDCTFEYLGFEPGSDKKTWQGGAVGSGIRSGCEMIFRNCNFIGNESNPFGCHSNINFEKPAYVRLEKCTFSGLRPSAQYTSIPIRSLKSGVLNKIEFIGCNFGLPIAMNPTQDEKYDWEITGYGNNLTVQINSFTDGQIPYCRFNGEVSMLQNTSGSEILAGTPVKRDIYSSYLGTNGVTIMKENDIVEKCIGIAINNAQNGEMVAVKTKGYLRTKLEVGKRVTIKNGKLSTLQDNEEAVCVGVTDVNGGYTRFKFN